VVGTCATSWFFGEIRLMAWRSW